MGLKLGMKAHAEGDLKLAEVHYKRALDQKVDNSILYQNYGALLRSLERSDEAVQIYHAGLVAYPSCAAIHLNLANCIRSSQPIKALFHYIQVIKHTKPSETKEDKKSPFIDPINYIISILLEFDCLDYAAYLLHHALSLYPDEASLLTKFMVMCSEYYEDTENTKILQNLESILESKIISLNNTQCLEIYLGLATYALSKEDSETARRRYFQARDFALTYSPKSQEEKDSIEKMMTTNSWNFGCTLLKLNDLEEGWKLFEHGLITPSPGKQRWQRALLKPFLTSELPLWRGQSLSGQKLLLLEEQAVGDVMMFLSLLPTLLNEADHIGLFLSDRLISIYQRTYADFIDNGKLSIYSHKDFIENRLDADSFTLQSPVGSICQYRFTSINSYAPVTPSLKPNLDRVGYFRDALEQKFKSSQYVGISWRGGGKAERIKQKSIDEDWFLDTLQQVDDVTFVNLQYGDCLSTLSKWKSAGLDVVNFEEVNPVLGLEDWLNLVASCDSVISVANTTIHGSGGLNIPTLCLLSRFADWRWLQSTDFNRSYWYPSVGIARQTKKDGWTNAQSQLLNWISNGCPRPHQ